MENKLIDMMTIKELLSDDNTEKRKIWKIDLTEMTEKINIEKAVIKINCDEFKFDIGIDEKSKIIVEILMALYVNDVNKFVKALEKIQDNIENMLERLNIAEYEIIFQ